MFIPPSERPYRPGPAARAVAWAAANERGSAAYRPNELGSKLVAFIAYLHQLAAGRRLIGTTAMPESGENPFAFDGFDRRREIAVSS